MQIKGKILWTAWWLHTKFISNFVWFKVQSDLFLFQHESCVSNIRLSSKQFCLQPFFLQDSVSLLFTQFTISVRFPQSKTFWNLSVRFIRKWISKTLSDSRGIGCTSFFCIGNNFSWNFKVLWGFLKKSWLEEPSGRDWVS